MGYFISVNIFTYTYKKMHMQKMLIQGEKMRIFVLIHIILEKIEYYDNTKVDQNL